MSLTLVILAAGSGTRYGGLKQLAPIGPHGEALLEYSVHDALRSGFSRVVLVIRPESEPDFAARLGGRMATRVPLAYAHQRLGDLPCSVDSGPRRARPWGTAQAVLAAEPEVPGPFAVVNADDFYGAGSFDALARFLSAGNGSGNGDLAVVGFEASRTLTDAGPVSRALCRVDDRGFLRGIVELEMWREGGRIICRGAGHAGSELDGDELVSMNMWGFTPGLFAELRRRFESFLEDPETDLEHAELRLSDVIGTLLRENRVRVEVLRGTGPWCGITFREDSQSARSIIASLVRQGHYPEDLWG